MKLLYEVLESADPLKLESLFSRLPNMFNIVVYILDQVRALEEELLHKIELQFLDVKPHILVKKEIHREKLREEAIGVEGVTSDTMSDIKVKRSSNLEYQPFGSHGGFNRGRNGHIEGNSIARGGRMYVQCSGLA
ncbi:hypothetical protein JHK87_001560 [Glycine soja]|nr:hypothetical protein JHK87_001560 [Glycine soja]